MRKFAFYAISNWNFDDEIGNQIAFDIFLENPISKMNLEGSEEEIKLKGFASNILEVSSRKSREYRGALVAKRL